MRSTQSDLKHSTTQLMIKDMKHQSVKRKLSSKKKLNGCWIEAFCPIAAEIMAMSGYDAAMIDLEHGAGSYLEAISMMQALNNHGCAPMLRVTSAGPAEIKRALDIGPEALMVPNIRSAGEARDVVAACRYGPGGIRGAAPGIIRATAYGREVPDYLSWMTTDFLLIGQVESAQAVEDIDEIVGVDGLDMLFIGPSDLSASLGALGNYDSENFRRAFEKIEHATLTAGKYLGTIPFPGWSAERLYKNGHSLVLSGADTLLLRQAAEADVREMHRSAAASGESD